MSKHAEKWGREMTDQEVLRHIMDDVKYLRTRIDAQGKELTDHVREDAKSQRCIQKQLSKLETACAVSDSAQEVKLSGLQKGSIILIIAFVSFW
jgi:hypothetical protein